MYLYGERLTRREAVWMVATTVVLIVLGRVLR